MTSRIGQPDTPADISLRECLEAEQPISFSMIAGAGSGKTTSLVKALDYLGKTRGTTLKKRGQKIACITYTEVAEKEILEDIGDAPIFHVSTIHSFLWALVRPFQNDIRTWVANRINEKIIEAEAKIAKPRTRQTTIDKARLDIERYQAQIGELGRITKFTYGTGSNYAKGILGHDDVLRMVPAIILERPLFRTVVADRFPFIFVDESQDTTEVVVESLKAIAAQLPDKFCLGFFGDPMQKIYANGIGVIAEGVNWRRIEKHENFRSPLPVLTVINNIRANGDGLEQIQGRPGIEMPGSTKVFILPIDVFRKERLQLVRNKLSIDNNDPLWLSDAKEGDVRMLVIVHRMAAARLGFADLHSAFNDNKPPAALKDGFIEGSSWALTPFLSHVLPLVEFARENKQFDLISLLRNSSPLFIKESIANEADIPAMLGRLKDAVTELVDLMGEDSEATVADVLRHIRENHLMNLEDRLNEMLSAFDNDELQEGEDGDDTQEATMYGATAIRAYFNCPAKLLWAYRTYINDESPFSTQQGIKGAEFKRVLTVLDDDEGSYNLFSYNKYFGISALSDTDNENIATGNDSVIDRTRRLFYVSCSRAVRDLAVVLFASNVEFAREKVVESRIFPEENIYLMNDPIVI